MASPLLVIESNPTIERQLTDILASSGYTLYGLDSPESLIKILDQRSFPLVMIDAMLPGLDPLKLLRLLRERYPETSVIATGSGLSMDKVLLLMRAGAVDYLAKPFDPTELTRSVHEAFHRAENTASLASESNLPDFGDNDFGDNDLDESFPTLAPPPEAEEVTLSAISEQRLTEFLDTTLQTFLELEKNNHELRIQVQELKDPSKAQRRKRQLSVWVAHPDETFCKGVASLADPLNVLIHPPLAMGGSLLDRLSSKQPDIVILADMLADIPGPFVLNTITSDYPNLVCVMISNWNTNNMEGELTGPKVAEKVTRKLKSVDDLVALLKEAKMRCYDIDMGMEFAREFKERHSTFIENYTEIKRALLKIK